MNRLEIPCIDCGGRGKRIENGDPIARLFVCQTCYGDGAARCIECGKLAEDAMVDAHGGVVPLCALHMEMEEVA